VAELMPTVYQELRQIARGFFTSERSEHTLQPTAVVHEAFVRLVERGTLNLESRAHFVGIAARVMRQVLVDHGRSHGAEKRGGDRRRITLVDAAAVVPPVPVDVLDLHEALEHLEALDERMAAVVELRSFGGLSIDEVAELLGVSPASVSRLWRRAKAWLYQVLIEGPEDRRAEVP
jgi:RNA polymerase sigma factor (TIGR02999 family)